ncbi:MAG TPA: hypothetical protein VGZ47_00195 [Gemmataceae bacterium]|jgi:cupin 2 domain-containing protein|nr:hypothetical protein [Gemmataceae bacterium]
MTEVSNLFANIPENSLRELSETLVASDVVRIERMVSYGHISPPGFWYDQDTHESVLVLQGAASCGSRTLDQHSAFGDILEWRVVKR